MRMTAVAETSVSRQPCAPQLQGGPSGSTMKWPTSPARLLRPCSSWPSEDNPGRHAGADAHIDEVLAVGGIVELVDTQGGGAHVVLKRNGYAKALAQAHADRIAVPKEIHGHDRDTVDGIHLAGHAQADAGQSVRDLRFAQCQVDTVGDALQRGVGAAGVGGDGGLVDGPQLLVHELGR